MGRELQLKEKKMNRCVRRSRRSCSWQSRTGRVEIECSWRGERRRGMGEMDNRTGEEGWEKWIIAQEKNSKFSEEERGEGKER